VWPYATVLGSRSRASFEVVSESAAFSRASRVQRSSRSVGLDAVSRGQRAGGSSDVLGPVRYVIRRGADGLEGFVTRLTLLSRPGCNIHTTISSRALPEGAW
jgi:hypothetical protein